MEHTKVTVGQKATCSLTFTKAEVEAYAKITGDYNPRHFDEAFAARTEFGALVVHGGLTAGILNARVARDLPGPGTVFMGQMSLHADVAVPARDCRRLERLAPLIPPPRSHQVRYHGVLAPFASGRDRIVPGREVGGAGGSRPGGSNGPHRAEHGSAGIGRAVRWGRIVPRRSRRRRPDRSCRHSGRIPVGAVAVAAWETEGERWARSTSLRAETEGPRRRTEWADLRQRVFEVDALCCPRCGGRMRILSAITDPDVARRIRACLDLPARAPPHGSSTEGIRISGAEPSPDLAGGEWDEDAGFDFDQFLPGDGVIGSDG